LCRFKQRHGHSFHIVPQASELALLLGALEAQGFHFLSEPDICFIDVELMIFPLGDARLVIGSLEDVIRGIGFDLFAPGFNTLALRL
jgi:hypothetical protein